jgi:CHASE2 domain-containing sensor protein
MNKNKKLLFRDTIVCMILSYTLFAFLSIFVINISFFNPFKKIVKDFSFLDVYHAKNFSDNKSINSDIIIINIEHRNRLEISQLLNEVLKTNPKVVGVDMVFKELKESFSDSLLASNIRNKRVVQTYVISENTYTYNNQIFRNKTEGFANFNFENQESVIRDFEGVYNKKLAWSTQIAKTALGDSIWKERNYLKHLVGNTPIKYHGGQDAFIVYSFKEFMLQTNKSILKDKIVLLGYTGDPTGNKFDIEDKYFTPINPVTSGKSIPDMFGVVVHANIINMLINNDFLYRISNFWIIVLSIIFNFLLIRCFIKIEKLDKLGARTKRKIIVFFFSILMVGISFLLFKYGIVLKVAPIIAIVVFSASVIKYYKHLIRYIIKKTTWKSYL